MDRLAQQQIRPERQLRPGREQVVTVLFRLIYYAVIFLISGVLVGVLYVGGLLE